MRSAKQKSGHWLMMMAYIYISFNIQNKQWEIRLSILCSASEQCLIIWVVCLEIINATYIKYYTYLLIRVFLRLFCRRTYWRQRDQIKVCSYHFILHIVSETVFLVFNCVAKSLQRDNKKTNWSQAYDTLYP